MKNKDLFIEKVVESAEIVIDIKDTFRKKLNVLTALFTHGIGRPKGEFKKLLKLKHSVDGYPTDKSKAKLSVVLEDFIHATKYYNFIGDGDVINRILANHGLKLEITDNNRDMYEGDKENRSKYQALWEQLFPDEPIPDNKKELLNYLIEKAIPECNAIQELTEEIEGHAEQVSHNCDTAKTPYKKAVGLKKMMLEGVDIGEKVKKMEDEADQLSQAIEAL